MTKIGHFLRGFFSCRFFRSRFSWPFKDFSRLNAKKSCSCISRIFTGRAMRFCSLISKLVVLLIKGEMHRSNVQLLLKAKKQFTTGGLFISAMFHVKLIRRHAFIYATTHEIYGIFLLSFESFCGEFYKKYSTGNEEWIEFETATITSDYVLHNHLSIS